MFCAVKLKGEIVTVVVVKFHLLFNKELIKDWSRIRAQHASV